MCVCVCVRVCVCVCTCVCIKFIQNKPNIKREFSFKICFQNVPKLENFRFVWFFFFVFFCCKDICCNLVCIYRNFILLSFSTHQKKKLYLNDPK